MFAAKRSSIRQSRHSRRDAAVDRQKMELPIPLPADHPLQLGIFTSALLGTFESALTVREADPADPLLAFEHAVVADADRTQLQHSQVALLAGGIPCGPAVAVLQAY